MAELKEEGDKRASRYGRYFPLPRLNVVAARINGKDLENAYNPDGSIRWDKKAIKLGSYNIIPVSPTTEPFSMSSFELQKGELPYTLQQLVDEIYEDTAGQSNDDSNEEETRHEEY